MEAEFTDDGMVDRGRAAVETADVVTGPQGAEPLAGQREFADEFDEPGVVGVVADGGAQRGDEIGGGSRPVLLEGLFLGIEEEGTQPVLAGPQPGGEGDGHGVGGQDVERATLDERGDLQVGEQLVHPRRHVLRPHPARRPGPCRGEAEQIRPLDVVEPQDPRE